jgi:PAS domain S-box-containing protein
LTILYITGEESRVEGIQSGADDYLVKPFSARELLARVRSLLQINRLRQQSEHAIRASEERFRTLFDSMDEAFCVVEMLYDSAHRPVDYRFLEANPTFERHTGIADGVGRTIRELVPDHDAHWFEIYGQVAETGEPIRFVNEAKAMGRWYDVYAYRVGGPGSGKVGILFTDITERKRADDSLKLLATQLAEADRRKDEFLAILAHELRNPLAPIRNGLQIMRLANGESETIEQARTMMERQLGQMVHLVDDLLDLSRISRGKIELRKERVELSKVIQQAIETSRPLIEQSGHDLTTTMPPGPIYVDADITRLSQVFSNLLNNAAKYTEQGGRVELTVQRGDSEAIVSVKDNGVGIPAHMLPHVFEMFTQVDRNLERSQGGLGIGLSIVERLVQMHGGSVAVDSEGPGTGSEFVVRLPVALSTVHRSDGDTEATTPLSRRRILVVDDNKDAAVSLAMMLRLTGNEARTAHDGMEALNVAEEYQPDFILLDIGMPRLNGHETAKRIRQQPWGKGMVLVALTGWGQQEDRQRTAEAGFDHHLVKPADAAEINRLLAEWKR